MTIDAAPYGSLEAFAEALLLDEAVTEHAKAVALAEDFVRAQWAYLPRFN